MRKRVREKGKTGGWYEETRELRRERKGVGNGSGYQPNQT
jgi:hypothetical protein